MITERTKTLVRKYFLFSVKSTINSLYLPIMIVFIIIIGWVSTLLATKQIEENTYNSMSDTVYQTKNYLEYMLSDAFQQLVAISNDPKIQMLAVDEEGDVSPETYIAFDNKLQVIYSHFNVMLESILIDINRGEFSVYRNSDQSFPTISYEDYFEPDRGNNESYYWRNLHSNQAFAEGNKVVSVYKLINNQDTSTEGIILFNFREDFFKQILNKSLIEGNGYLTLISPDGHFESKDVEEEYQLDESMITYLQTVNKDVGRLTFKNKNNETMIALYDTIGVNKWKLVSIIPQSEILQRVNYIKYLTFTLIAVMSVIAIFLSNFIGRFVSGPFEKLARQMKTIESTNLHLNFEMSGPKEMKILQNGFNQLNIQIHALMNQIRLEQEEKRQLEFAVMHAQINPHFLYNTLYSIKGLSDMGLNEDASKMVMALSSFFRIGISKGKEIISIKEEVEHIENYLYIQEMRYGDDFSYKINVSEKILNYNIIKLSLQPLLENSIYHGVKQKRGQAKIEICGYEKDDLIYLDVIDNGSGINKEKLEDIQKELNSAYGEKKRFIGVGLQSVNERVKIHFGKEYGIFIVSDQGEGTKVTIIIPKTKGEINDHV
ncbi:sensor histidine kinase [Pradoshia sp. D12]|uniref:cache domain-containing sensor histidine kinase n=1 Tax=Bacillaceae TaxID=186817 RepID=UPI0011268393|nr:MULTISPECIES: sensor histidine kinase [Bacillaceae]QFK71213.1 sensor histidine kinase [Pradoshia sp. D12]TPF73006.1 sensor histidine kinase [Bacillus sp. D12]